MAETMTNNVTVKTMETLEDVITFHKTWLESVTGREFSKVLDNASTYEENGNAYSYMLELGGGDASTRFQTWITARKRGGVRCDLFVGNTYISTDTINVAGLATYRKGNDCGKGNTYRNVPMSVVKEFFETNDLVKKTTTKKRESKTA